MPNAPAIGRLCGCNRNSQLRHAWAPDVGRFWETDSSVHGLQEMVQAGCTRVDWFQNIVRFAASEFESAMYFDGSLRVPGLTQHHISATPPGPQLAPARVVKSLSQGI